MMWNCIIQVHEIRSLYNKQCKKEFGLR